MIILYNIYIYIVYNIMGPYSSIYQYIYIYTIHIWSYRHMVGARCCHDMLGALCEIAALNLQNLQDCEKL